MNNGIQGLLISDEVIDGETCELHIPESLKESYVKRKQYHKPSRDDFLTASSAYAACSLNIDVGYIYFRSGFIQIVY